ncbi:MAG: UDP-3-O-[3-hydroxymyristoyl] N-acetylglucosamine deacetylase [Chlamydiae bacterium]|nr:UDP-3-O-[3-hydroxymyristoyl] N-acetylglucosamine deacetylase [Chlamydiota bacterium]
MSSTCVRKVRPAHTIEKAVKACGIGLFTGTQAEIALLPAPEGFGVVFQRMDLEGCPQLKASLDLVRGTPRCTIIGNESFSIQTVEHLMAALGVHQVDNLLIQLSGPEVPIFDGSARQFVQMLKEAGLKEQGEVKELFALQSPVYCAEKEAVLIAIPSPELKISYTLHYPHSSCIGTQFYSFLVQQESFNELIAPCRTFSVYEEISPLMEKGFLKGGSLDNAVVIKENKIMNPGGLRFPDEMVRHKILDMIGDLFLMGISFSAHIIAVRSGHHINNLFANQLLKSFQGGGL